MGVVEGKRVLIVDDHPDNRIVFGLLLEHFGCEVLHASDGWAGVEQARAHHPDLILMDVSMPCMNGLEATELLKINPETAEIPILVVTAHTTPEIKEQAREVGCDGFLTKPVAAQELLKQVEHVLQNGGGAEEA